MKKLTILFSGLLLLSLFSINTAAAQCNKGLADTWTEESYYNLKRYVKVTNLCSERKK